MATPQPSDPLAHVEVVRPSVPSVEECLRAILDFAPVILFAYDPQGLVTLSEGRALSALGLAPGQTVGLSSHDMYADRPDVLESVRRAVRGEEFTVVTDVNGVQLDTLFRPFHDASGRLAGTLGVVVNLTGRLQAEEALRRAELRLRGIIDSNMIGMFFWNIKGVICDANDEFLRIVGYDREDLRAGGINWVDLTPPQFAHLDALATEQIRARGVCTPYEKEYVRKDGTRVPVMVGGAVLGDAGGSGVGFLLDLSERKRSEDARRLAEEERAKLQAQLVQVQKLESLGVLAGGIAHDFNNLLTAISGSVSVAMLELSPSSPAQPALQSALLAVRRAAGLTRQLLAYAGKGRFEVRPIDLSAHVREITHLLEATLPKKVRLELHLAGELPAVHADVAQIQQVVMNLVVNAAEAIGDRPGTVVVTTGTRSADEVRAKALFVAGEISSVPYVCLEVRDDGSGMDEETKAKIFDPFFTTKFTGRGLGLAAVLGIIRAHNGAIAIASALGQGTRFEVLLPASDAPLRAETGTEAETFRASGLVLLVDDDNWVRRAARMLLESFGFGVIEAENGRAAVRLMNENAGGIVAVVLDMTMPEMGGEETFLELRRIRRDVPVVLSSGYSESSVTQRFDPADVAGFLPKPFSSGDLASRMRAALAWRRAP